MATKKSKSSWKNTKHSKDKEVLNAIVTSDVTYKTKSETKNRFLKLSIFLYAFVIMSVICASLGLLAVPVGEQKDRKYLISLIEIVVFGVLLLDLLLRWYTSEVRMRKGNFSYLLFPISFTGILLIVSLLPSLYLINFWTDQNIKLFEIFRQLKFLRFFRLILLTNLIPGLGIFKRVLMKERSVLYVVFGVVAMAIIVFALLIFNVENGHNPKIVDFQDALYFATVALTTIGFGDISPVTEAGQWVVMVMSVFGIAILATPAGVISGGFISEANRMKKEKDKKSK